MKENIIGISYLGNAIYQHNIHNIANDILQNNKSIKVKDFMQKSIFNNIDDNLRAELTKKIINITGDDIDKNELKTVLILLDANLENVEHDGQTCEGFVMDSEFKIGKKNGIFEANKQEIGAINKIVTAYNYDNLEINQFPTYDGKTMKWYDRNDKYLGDYNPL